jgi:hypothetical protein
MTIFRNLRSWLAIAWILFLVPLLARAQQDIQVIGGTNPYIQIGRGLSWGGIGIGNLNNNFIFHPIDPNEGFCLFLGNNNPSSAHSVTVAVSQSGDPSLNQFNGVQGQWFNVPTVTAFPTSVPANTVVGINYKTTASATIAVSFSGATTQAGSPDTVNVFAVQTNQSSCGNLPVNSVQGPFQQNSTVTLTSQFPLLIGGLTAPGSTSTAQGMHLGTNGNGLLIDGGVCCQAFASGFQSNPAGSFSNFKTANGTSTELETVIDNFSMGFIGAKGVAPGYVANDFLEVATNQFYLTASANPAFTVFGRAVNPAANTTIIHNFDKVNSTVNPAYKRLILSCSAACEIFVNRTSAQGTTCTALTIQNMQLGNGGTVQAANANDVAENACATQPTVTYTFMDVQLGAGATQVIDLTGFVNFHSSTNGAGLSVVENSTVAAGNVSATLEFMEQ